MWAKNEKSTRNCFYAKVVGGRVHCAKRHKFMTIDGGLSVVNVIGHKKLFYPCRGCPDRDIDWDGKSKLAGVNVSPPSPIKPDDFPKPKVIKHFSYKK